MERERGVCKKRGIDREWCYVHKIPSHGDGVHDEHAQHALHASHEKHAYHSNHATSY